MKKLASIFLTTILLLNMAFDVQAQDESNNELTLDLVMKSRKFYPQGVRGISPLNNGDHFSKVQSDSLNVYSYKTGDFVEVIVTSDEMIPEGDTVPISLKGYQFSPDESKILFPTETESIYRRSSKSNFYIFDRETRKLIALSGNGKQRLADFSPDNSKVAFVRENNIFVKDLQSGEEKQITFDGKDRHIINGTTDWVYEEELSLVKGFHWSPEGDKIAFMRFDESDVKEWTLTYYGELYPEEHSYKYPKAGEDNSIVTVHVYDLKSGKTTTMDIGEETDQYIPRIKWITVQNQLAIYRLNRLQNKLEILFTDASSGSSKVVYTEVNKYYIEDGNYDNITFLDNGSRMILNSEQSGYNHIYLFDIEMQELQQITTGNWDVTDLIGVDQDKENIYYQSAEVSPMDRNVYSIGFNGKGKKELTPEAGSNSARFSSNFKYFIKTWSDANTPPVYSVNNGKNGKLIRVLEDNEKLRESLAEYPLSQKEFFTFTTSEGIVLNGWKIMPFNFDPNKKYPVLFDIYGGPGSQTVRNSFGRGDMWQQYLAQEDVMVVSVDTRGSGARGEEFKKMTYQQLGKYETIDLVEAGKYLSSLPYVDGDHIGIFGWSYGGYMSSLCMTKGAEVFDVGIAVAPVTNWRYYDNIYTERFMRTPQENPDGYDDNSPINHAEKMEGKFLLLHGMADDNVHPQNTYDFATALVAADKDFEFMVYPNSNHGIYTGSNTRFHLYKKMTDFLLGNLK